jgi:hypothetical protein
MKSFEDKQSGAPRRAAAAFLMVLGVVGASALSAPINASAVRELSMNESRASASEPGTIRVSQANSLTLKMNLPAVVNGVPDTNIFSMEMDKVLDANGLSQVVSTGVSFVRRSELKWKDVEAVEGQYNFAALQNNGIEQEMINAAQNNLKLIMIVRTAPDWAHQFTDTTCGPIKPSKRAAFGNFMNALVARYSKPPFNVKYWEIWNEPDVDPGLFTAAQRLDYPFGCYGNADDPYYGGREFGELLKIAYPRIKAADPTAVVMNGGLLMGCAPLGPGIGCESRTPPSSPLQSKFFEGMLISGAGNSVDIIAFHAYDNYRGALGVYGMGGYNSAWNTTGPAIHNKAAFLRQLLVRYGLPNKPLMNTEGGLGCPTDSCATDPTFESTVAYYVPQMFAAALAENLVANNFYGTTNPWNNSNLLRGDLSPKPGFNAMKVAVVQFSGARFVQRITTYPNAHVYELTRRGRKLWIVTSKTGGNVTIALPSTPSSVIDSLGVNVTPAANLTVGPNTLYVLFP